MRSVRSIRSAEVQSEFSAVAALLLAYGEGDGGNAWL